MTMKKRIKTAGALTLAAITVLSAAGLSSVYGALGVETDKKCSLTFTLDGTEFDELRSLEIPVDVYKVADITEEAVYDTTNYTDFADLGLEKVSSTTTAEEWAQMAEKAMETVEDKGIAPTADVKVTKPAGAAESTGVINNLETGMYLVQAETVQTSEYTYDFTPYLVSLIAKKKKETQFALVLQLIFHSGEEGISREHLEKVLFGERTLDDANHAIHSLIYNIRKKLSRGISERKKLYYSYNKDFTGTKRFHGRGCSQFEEEHGQQSMKGGTGGTDGVFYRLKVSLAV